MSRRYVKSSKFNSLDQPVPEIVAVVSAKDNVEQTKKAQTYFKQNYLEAIKKIIPSFYFSDEQTLSGEHIGFVNQVINSHLVANAHQATILPLSSLTDDTYLSAINTPSGFASYFFKDQNPATISPDDFERYFLLPLTKSYKAYSSSGEFLDYISGTFLPTIPVDVGVQNLATLTASAYANDSSGTYKFLADNLGWLFFLNREGPTNGFDPSNAVAELITTNLWKGRSIVLEDTINIYQEYLWRNKQWWGIDDIVPTSYLSSVEMSAGTWTSGTQLLDNLKTLNSIIYSPHYLNSPDQKVEDAFNTYINTEAKITDVQNVGPFTRFLEGTSFSLADRTNEGNELGVLYDIGKCPDEFLELLGELIGWRMIGADVDKWRVQLRNAVSIYKAKGTKKSIQILLDLLFGTDVYNVDAHIQELWESYLPDLLYYSLATSSAAFKNFKTYTPEVAQQLGILDYSSSSMDVNVKYAVDTILFNLVREFPDQFMLGGKPFPTLAFVYPIDAQKIDWLLGLEPDIAVWEGPYHYIDYDDGRRVYRTGEVETEDSITIKLQYDPRFVFQYRGREFYIPPYEKRQYYTDCMVSNKLVERVAYYLQCYGVDKTFTASVVKYIREYTTETVDTTRILNAFLMFGTDPTYPPNYDVIIKEATKDKTPDPVSLLSLWNGKSSHFLMMFDASSFDWGSHLLSYNTHYGLSQMLKILDQVVPAHAIPEVILSLSSVIDGMDAIADNDCRELRPNFYDLYEGSSTVTTGFAVSAVDMAAMATTNGLLPNRFKRGQVEDTHDFLLSGNTFQPLDSVNRNSLRRRNYHNLLPETKMFTRIGRNNPGSLTLSNSYYTSAIGYIPLGFVPSSQDFQPVNTIPNRNGYGIGRRLFNVHPVWDICQNLTSPSSMFGYDISNTFASRANLNLQSSSCQTYGRRGQLDDIMYVMNKMHDKEKFLQASSIVSGYYNDDGYINRDWTASSSLLAPNDLSSWYAEGARSGWTISVVKSIANQLINNEGSDESLSYYEHFKFGQMVNRLYNTYNSVYGSHPMSDNYSRLSGGPNIFSHTYSPLIYNANFDTDGSAIEVSSFLQTSSPLNEVDISYYGGSGILSISGMFGDHQLGTSAASGAADVYLNSPEFYNRHLVSSIELVDTSAPTVFKQHPIFSIFKWSRSQVNEFDYNKYLVNNPIIKYHRSSDNSLFPRVRVRIDNSDSTNKARNLLEPNHRYSVKLTAHNSDLNSVIIGGQTLGYTLRTEPEDGKVWIFDPNGVYDECGLYYDSWVQIPVSDLHSKGINTIKSYAQTFTFPIKEAEHAEFNPNVVLNNEGIHCYEALLPSVTLGTSPQTIIKIGKDTREEFEFKFSTYNNKGAVPPDRYKDTFGKIHRTDQKYVLEFFTMTGDDTKFIVFEKISITDLTNKEDYAVIETQYGNIELDKSDLKAVFRFFKDLQTGIASRNATTTSGVMEASGGSRLNYRSNYEMYPNVVSTGNVVDVFAADQLTEVDIHEG